MNKAFECVSEQLKKRSMYETADRFFFVTIQYTEIMNVPTIYMQVDIHNHI